MDTLLTTVHGSRLYGLHHDNSDYDTYSVLHSSNKKYVEQALDGKADDFRVSLDKFLDMCRLGVPQALEALFSPYAEMDARYEALFGGFRVGHTETAMRYRRTVRNFGFMFDVDEEVSGPHPSFKRRRHAYRLTFNLSECLRYGRFNPVLSQDEREFVTYAAGLDFPEHYTLLENCLGDALLAKPVRF